MGSYRLAKRYAKGLLEYAKEEKQETQVCNELKDLQLSLKNNRELNMFLSSPVLDAKKKASIAKSIFKDFSKIVQTFVQLVIQHGREADLYKISEQYVHLYNIEHSIHKAKIISATKLSEAQINQIIGKAKETFQEDWQYEVENVVDSDLIGGFVLRVEDREINASVRNKLNKLKAEFNKNEYVPKM